MNKQTTLGHFRRITENLPDSTIIVVPDSDHSYRDCRPEVTYIATDGYSYSEYYGDEHLDDESGEVKIRGIVIN